MARALLTDGERKAIRGDDDVDEGTQSTQRSRVRQKISQMRADAQLLREHGPEMYRDLRDAVLDEDVEARFERLEDQIEALQQEIQEDG